jgi:hypothetical protein
LDWGIGGQPNLGMTPPMAWSIGHGQAVAVGIAPLYFGISPQLPLAYGIINPHKDSPTQIPIGAPIALGLNGQQSPEPYRYFSPNSFWGPVGAGWAPVVNPYQSAGGAWPDYAPGLNLLPGAGLIPLPVWQLHQPMTVIAPAPMLGVGGPGTIEGTCKFDEACTDAGGPGVP